MKNHVLLKNLFNHQIEVTPLVKVRLGPESQQNINNKQKSFTL